MHALVKQPTFQPMPTSGKLEIGPTTSHDLDFAPNKFFSIDTETTGLFPWKGDKPFAVGMCDDSGHTWYCEWAVDPFTREVTPNLEDLQFIQYWIARLDLIKIFHNARFDVRMLAAVGLIAQGPIEDTLFAYKSINTLETSYGLKDLAARHIYYDDPKTGKRTYFFDNKDETDLYELTKKLRLAKKRLEWAVADDAHADYWMPKHCDPTNDLCEKYCRLDVKRTWALWVKAERVLVDNETNGDGTLWKTYQREMKLLWVVHGMEERGFSINRAKTQEELERAEREKTEHLERMIEILTDKMLEETASHSLTSLESDSERKAREKKKDPAARELIVDSPSRKQVQDKVEQMFNPGSSPQLVRLLFDDSDKVYSKSVDTKALDVRGHKVFGTDERQGFKGLFGLEVFQRTDNGAPSTDWKALRFYNTHPFVRELMAYRSADKSIGTFFGKYMELMIPDPLSPGEWCLHPGLNQMGTITGRFSCAAPNLQQVANSNTNARGTDPIQARRPFQPRRGYALYLADYAQQELRIFADYANITSMMDAIANGRDPNTENANRVWGGRNNPAALQAAAFALELGQDNVTKDEVREAWSKLGWNKERAKYGMLSHDALMVAERWLAEFDYQIVAAEKSLKKSGTRGRSKIVTFAKIYGGGDSAVQDLLYCSPQEAHKYMTDWDKAFPEIRTYSKWLTGEATREGYVVNKYGRRIGVDPDFAYRCVNYMIQSSAADMMKEAILRCHEFLVSTGLDAHVLMTVHDELIFEIKKEHAYKWVLRKLIELMEQTPFRLPMKAEMQCAEVQWDKKREVIL